MSYTKPIIICLTPVKNESWILEKFLKSASLWADHIIIADQNSEDNSKEIAAKFPKVHLINNPNQFHEGKRQALLLSEARKIVGPKLLIALDADEVLTSNFLNESFIEKLSILKPGTIVKSKFINLTPDFTHYWESTFNLPWGFMDDNSIHTGREIHSLRFPITDSSQICILDEVKIMHFQFTDWERMESKQRWYQCWEKINNPAYTMVKYYRGYHHMYSVKDSDIKPVPDDWIQNYIDNNIDLKAMNKAADYYWDKEVLNYMESFGVAFFSKVPIWDVAWDKKAVYYGLNDPERFKDPRKKFEKIIHNWLKKTQKSFYSLPNRIIAKILKIAFGW